MLLAMLYTMQFITRTNRHQTLVGTLEAQVAAEYPVGLVDSFVAALNAKNPTCKALYERPWRKAHFCRWRLLLAPIFAVVKSGVLYQDDSSNKMA
jgi:hypothetical protein